MGASIAWNNDTQTVTATKGATVVVLAIGSTSPTINGQAVAIDQPGIIVDGRTLAPLRFVAEAFGGTVAWDGSTQTASITMGT
jgi:N-acetylmuramoyl-L-alanine amidase